MFLVDKIKEKWDGLNEVWKKLILGIGFIIIGIFLAWLVYLVFFAPSIKRQAKPIPPPETGRLPEEIEKGAEKKIQPKIETGRLPIEKEPKESALPTLPPDEVAKGGITKSDIISTRPVVSPTISADQRGFNYYDNITSKFYRIPIDGGEPKQLSDKEFQGVEKVTWSPEGSKSVIEFIDGSNILYNFVTKRQVTLPKEAQDFSFSARSGKIAYEFVSGDPEENWVVVADENGRNGRAVEELSPDPDDMQITFSPTEQFVALFRKGSDVNTQDVYFIGQNQENFKKLKTKGRGFTGKWSPKGNRLLYSVYLEEELFRPTLFIANSLPDTIGTDNNPLEVQTTADKCAFDSDNINIYCAVPVYMPQGAGLYSEALEGVPDEIYQINTRTGLRRKLAIPVGASGAGNFAIKNIMLSNDGKTLYLLDDANLLRSLKIKE